jgi:hypothetical protein
LRQFFSGDRINNLDQIVRKWPIFLPHLRHPAQPRPQNPAAPNEAHRRRPSHRRFQPRLRRVTTRSCTAPPSRKISVTKAARSTSTSTTPASKPSSPARTTAVPSSPTKCQTTCRFGSRSKRISTVSGWIRSCKTRESDFARDLTRPRIFLENVNMHAPTPIFPLPDPYFPPPFGGSGCGCANRLRLIENFRLGNVVHPCNARPPPGQTS